MAIDIFAEVVDVLPTELREDPKWADLRNEVMTSLREDSKGLPMNTSQNMLLERIATFYVVMRKRESEGEKLSFQDIRQNQTQWVALLQELNKQLQVNQDQLRSEMIKTILKIIQDAVTMVEDERIREDLRKTLQEKFKAAGF